MDLVGKRIMIVLLILLAINSTTVYSDALESSTNMLLENLRSTPMDVVLFWNLVAVQTVANDHDPAVTSILDQGGATLVSRALAIIHGAMYDAMVVFHPSFKPVFIVENLPTLNHVPKRPAMKAAIMEAAYKTLYTLYPMQRPMFDTIRTAYFKKTRKPGRQSNAIRTGIVIGQKIASTILKARENDGSKSNVTYTPTLKPGYHRVDPTHPAQGYNAPYWGSVKPFILDSVAPFRAANIVGDSPSSRLQFLNSSEYINAYKEVKSIGARNSTVRTSDQTEIGNFWGYDGAPKVGPAPRLFNQVVRAVAIQMNNTLVENAHLFALVNYALVDGRISTWDTKYYYSFWRPIVAIREGTPFTPPDANWLPLGAPADGKGDNFTPSHPSHVSGHVTSSSGTFEILRRFYRTDNVRFAFQSDEYNGHTTDSNTGQVRPSKMRQFQSFTQAEMEVFLARIYLGIHWRFDQLNAQIVAHKVAASIYKTLG